MSTNLRHLFDFLWSSPLDDQMPPDGTTISPQPSPVKQRTLRRTRVDSIDIGQPRNVPLPSVVENIELRPLRPYRRRESDGSLAVGFTQRIRDLENSNAEYRKLADDRQHRIRALEKETADLKSQTDTALKRLQAIQSANNSFVGTISKLERELHTLKFQHAPCANRISSTQIGYTSLLAAHTVLKSTYDDLRSSHQTLQSSCSTLQMSHSCLLFSNAFSFQQPSPSRPLSPLIPQRQLPRIEIQSPILSRESSIQTSPPISPDESNAGSNVSHLKTLLNDRTSELTSLQMFLSKHDEWSGAQVVQAVRDLNGEIARLAAAVSEQFSVVTGTSSVLPDDNELQTLLEDVLGPKLYNLLISRSTSSSSDPSLMIQYALQAWQLWCCSQILDKFCFGLPDDVEKWLAGVWEEMRVQGTPPHKSTCTIAHTFFFVELQPMSSRWRGLTHGYLRTSLQTKTPTTQLPTPPASPSLSALDNPRSLLAKRQRDLWELNLKGIRGILTLFDSNSNSSKLEEEFGDSVKRIQEQAMNIARVVREGVMSGWFELVRVPASTRSQTKESPPVAVRYDDEGMENVFKGFGREEGGVLCAVEFGLVCVRKDDKDENPERGRSPGCGADVLDRRVLMKPKVLLESVEEIL